MNICFIVEKYPTESFPTANAFVETLVNAMVDRGEVCYVIAPQSITNAITQNRDILPYEMTRQTPGGNSITVYTPKYFSFSVKKIGKLNFANLTLRNFRNAAEQVYKKISKLIHFDAIYGHFIFESGIVANYLGQKYGVPSFFAYGENTTYTIDYLGDEKTRRLLNGVSGIVSVSSENKRVLLSHKLAKEKNIKVFPNSIDTSVFYPRNKDQMREKLGFPKDAYIIAFVGRLLPVKGPDRLSAAIEEITENKPYSFYLGEGPLKPTCGNILFCNTVQHNQAAEYLSAADVFVLPTLAEGCCNAIVEAMACGLPIISSALPFNDDILTDKNSIRVDPMNIKEIADAIVKLRDDEIMRENMSKASLATVQQLTIDNRAKGIISFMNKQIAKKQEE